MTGTEAPICCSANFLLLAEGPHQQYREEVTVPGKVGWLPLFLLFHVGLNEAAATRLRDIKRGFMAC